MAILPTNTNTTVTSFISYMGTPLTPQGELTLIELLSGAVNSLRNDAPAQANSFIERLQEVSPATANWIFHLTWERSGKPMNLGDRFGEEAFFGRWRRSIDPNLKLEILSQVLQETAVPSPVLNIPEIAFEVLSHCDLQTLGRLARVNRFLNACVKNYDEQLDLKRFCPNLRILDAEAQEITINDEPSVSKRWILENYTKLEPHVENGEGLTLLTMPRGLTLNQLIAIGAQAGVNVNYWNQTVREHHRDVPIEQTYVILITNNVFKQSRNKNYAEQKEIVAGHRCVIPIVQEYVALCVFTNKVFQKCLYGEDSWTYGHISSTPIDGHDWVVTIGGDYTAPAGLHVYDYLFSFAGEYYAVGGQRKFGH